MKFYRLHLTYEAGTSAGYSFHSARAEAEKTGEQWVRNHRGVDDVDGATGWTVEKIEITPTKVGILRALNLYANHADNG